MRIGAKGDIIYIPISQQIQFIFSASAAKSKCIGDNIISIERNWMCVEFSGNSAMLWKVNRLI